MAYEVFTAVDMDSLQDVTPCILKFIAISDRRFSSIFRVEEYLKKVTNKRDETRFAVYFPFALPVTLGEV
jgi:hypothetical protein